MASVNKVTLLGIVGREPELRHMADGTAVVNISIATSRRRKDKISGESIEETQWHRITFYDRLAQIAGEYVKKGRPVYVEGRLRYGTYIDKTTGVEKHTVDITATELQLLGGRDKGEHRQQATEPPQAPRAAGPSGFDDMDDDIPF